MRINFWYISSFLISLIVIIPILTVFSSFFEQTTNYFDILKETFLFEYTYTHAYTYAWYYIYAYTYIYTYIHIYIYVYRIGLLLRRYT